MSGEAKFKVGDKVNVVNEDGTAQFEGVVDDFWWDDDLKQYKYAIECDWCDGDLHIAWETDMELLNG